MRKVAIIGRCWSTRADAPWDSDWEIWGLAWDPLPKVDRIFETHNNFRMYLGSQEEGDFHVGGLRMAKVPVYMLERHEDIPTSVALDMQAITAAVGKATGKTTPYLESSLAYMMAQAILELQPGDRIGIWGVDLHCESEYVYQRPNLEYLIGLARGRGIKVYIPPQSALMSHAKAGVPYGYWTSTQ